MLGHVRLPELDKEFQRTRHNAIPAVNRPFISGGQQFPVDERRLTAIPIPHKYFVEASGQRKMPWGNADFVRSQLAFFFLADQEKISRDTNWQTTFGAG